MRNFVIFFTGREGTSPLMKLLDNFEQVSILHQSDKERLEPFDEHECGPITVRNLERCLDHVLGQKPIDFVSLNRIYTKTAAMPLIETGENCSVGFKMRFKPPGGAPLNLLGLDAWDRMVTRFFWQRHKRSFRQMMFRVLKRNNPVAFFTIRRDLLRWSLSRYHGDGRFGKGHIQFDLASGKIKRDDIGKMEVDCERLAKMIELSENLLARKYRLMKALESGGIECHPLYYEDFLADKNAYFRCLMDFLEIDISDEEIDKALEKGAYFQKVHSDDISDFVINHQEVLDRFGDRQYLE